MKLDGGVGDNQPNRWRDVWTVQKGLANTGHHALDFTKEKSGEYSPGLRRSVENFQSDKGEKVDGTLLPGGPTIARLGETLLGSIRSGAPRDEKLAMPKLSLASAGSLTNALGPLLSPRAAAAPPEGQSLSPEYGFEAEAVTPVQDTRPTVSQGDTQRRRTHREAEDRGLARYPMIDLPESARARGGKGRFSKATMIEGTASSRGGPVRSRSARVHQPMGANLCIPRVMRVLRQWSSLIT